MIFKVWYGMVATVVCLHIGRLDVESLGYFVCTHAFAYLWHYYIGTPNILVVVHLGLRGPPLLVRVRASPGPFWARHFTSCYTMLAVNGAIPGSLPPATPLRSFHSCPR